MDDLFEDIRKVVGERAQVSLVLSEREIWGGHFPVLRPTDLEDQPSFSIVLVSSRSQATASFVPDVFAGLLMRKMRDNLSADTQPWKNFLEESRELHKVFIRVDNRSTDVENILASQWQRIEFDCVVDFSEDHYRNNRRTAFIEATTACLSMVLLALDSGEQDDIESYLEATASQTQVTKYERNAANRLRCIQYWGSKCWVCDFDFSETYGLHGDGFIEVHHIRPLATYSSQVVINPRTDLIPLCSNCHSMIHRRDTLNPLMPDVLREIIGKPPR